MLRLGSDFNVDISWDMVVITLPRLWWMIQMLNEMHYIQLGLMLFFDLTCSMCHRQYGVGCGQHHTTSSSKIGKFWYFAMYVFSDRRWNHQCTWRGNLLRDCNWVWKLSEISQGMLGTERPLVFGMEASHKQFLLSKHKLVKGYDAKVYNAVSLVYFTVWVMEVYYRCHLRDYANGWIYQPKD